MELSPPEITVLSVLFRERGNAVSRGSLLTEVWSVHYYGTTHTLDQLIVKLRQKIEDVPSEPRRLLTVHTLGYRLENLTKERRFPNRRRNEGGLESALP